MKDYRAGIYLRLSREHPEENNSIEAQREITTNYAIKNGYKIIEEYEDNGYSGILDSRPGLNRMMLDISRGYINMVIVKDISRLTRDKNKTGWYTEKFFPDNDVRFISVTEFLDSGERYEIDDTIMLRGIANQYYIADISKKVRANKKAMRDNGQYVEHYTPYGYKKKKEDKHQIEIDEDVAENIKMIFDMYIQGKTGSQIADFLNDKKIKNPSRYMKMKNASKKWSPETINTILSNPFYCGNTVTNKYITNYMKKTCKINKDRKSWIIKENTHEAIISKEQYNRVQEIKDNKHKEKGTTYQFLLKDLLYCGHCKSKYQYKLFKSKDRKKYLYDSAGFKCSMVYKRPEKCKNKTFINEKHINEIVIAEVQKRLSFIEINQTTNKVIDYYKQNSEEYKNIKNLKNEIEKLERRKSILYNKKCDKTITIEEFKKQYEKIKSDINSIKSKIEKFEENHNSNINEERIKGIIEDYKNGKEFTNEFLKEIIKRIEVYSDLRVEVIFNL